MNYQYLVCPLQIPFRCNTYIFSIFENLFARTFLIWLSTNFVLFPSPRTCYPMRQFWFVWNSVTIEALCDTTSLSCRKSFIIGGVFTVFLKHMRQNKGWRVLARIFLASDNWWRIQILFDNDTVTSPQCNERITRFPSTKFFTYYCCL